MRVKVFFLLSLLLTQLSIGKPPVRCWAITTEEFIDGVLVVSMTFGCDTGGNNETEIPTRYEPPEGPIPPEVPCVPESATKIDCWKKVVRAGTYVLTPGQEFGAPRGDGFHNGIDISATTGSSVSCTEDGVVSEVGNDPNSRNGLYVAVDHGGGVITKYLHLSITDVRVGQTIEAGEHLGRSGSSGRSASGSPYSPHLHLSLITGQNGKGVPMYDDPRNRYGSNNCSPCN